MPRRTKEDALATRDALLDAAELVFEAQGVAATSLNRIAEAAGVTRGAVYWHFRDKADLFDAMMARATLPFERQWQQPLPDDRLLQQLRELLLDLLRQTARDERLQRVFRIATQKIEYAGETRGVCSRHLEARQDFVQKLQGLLGRAHKLKLLRRGVVPGLAAVGLHALIDGLLSNWLLEPTRYDLVRTGRQAIDAYLGGLAAAPVEDPGS